MGLSRKEVKAKRNEARKFVPSTFYRMVRKEGGIPPSYRRARLVWKKKKRDSKKKGKETKRRKKPRKAQKLIVVPLRETVVPRQTFTGLYTPRHTDWYRESCRAGQQISVPGRVETQRKDPLQAHVERILGPALSAPILRGNDRVPSKSAQNVLFPVSKWTEPPKDRFLKSKVRIPEETGSQRLAIVIPSGEGKTTFIGKERKVLGLFFDIDEVKTLPEIRVTRKVGEAEFIRTERDFSGFESKVLLVRNLAQVPYGFDVAAAFALCECGLSHPHTDELDLERKGGVRMNREDREMLPIGTICYSDHESRNKELKRIASRRGVVERWAEVTVKARRANESKLSVERKEDVPETAKKSGWLSSVFSFL